MLETVHAITLSILYLDDSPTALREVELALTPLGHTVRSALSVIDAKGKLAGTDLVIVDFHMPEMNGEQALAELRAAHHTREPPVYYLYTTDTNIAGRFKEFGFDGALTWKGNLDALGPQILAIARILKMRRFMSQNRSA